MRVHGVNTQNVMLVKYLKTKTMGFETGPKTPTKCPICKGTGKPCGECGGSGVRK